MKLSKSLRAVVVGLALVLMQQPTFANPPAEIVIPATGETLKQPDPRIIHFYHPLQQLGELFGISLRKSFMDAFRP